MSQRLEAVIASKYVDREVTVEEVDSLTGFSGVGFSVDAQELAALQKLQQKLEQDALTNAAAEAANRLLGTRIQLPGVKSSPAARATLGAFIERNRDTEPKTLGARLARFADNMIDLVR